MFKSIVPAVALIVLTAALAHAQHARVVSASFFDPGNPDTGPLLSTSIAGVPPSQYSVPTDIRVSNWNNLEAQFGSVSGDKLNLFDSLGTITTVDAEWIASDVTSNVWQGAILNGDSTMMNGQIQSTTIAGPHPIVTINVTDLGNTFDLGAGYEVIVYVDAGATGSEQSLLVDDGILVSQALTIRDVVADAPPPRAFDAPVDYVEANFVNGDGVWARFPGRTGPQFTIEAMSTGVHPAVINGFQIVGYHAATGTGSDADVNGDGMVTGDDLVDIQRGMASGKFTRKHLRVWHNDYGAISASPISAVPEPSAICLALVGIAATVRRMR